MINSSFSILIVSNPFGYGPTGQAISLIKGLQNKSNDEDFKFNIFFAGSGLCLDIIKDVDGINIIEVDERDEQSLFNVIETIPNLKLCIGIQNRFIPTASKKAGIRCYFIDGLAWLWDPYPAHFLIADRILWTDFPTLNTSKIENEKVTIIGELASKVIWKPRTKDEFILLCLGGQENPLRSGLQENYLKLTQIVINRVALKTNINIIVTLGQRARQFIEQLPDGSSLVKFLSVSHKDNLELFSYCKKFISVGGQSSTFESLNSNIPTIFYLPSNLSQIQLIKKFNLTKMNWDDFVRIPHTFYSLSEKEAIDTLEGYSHEILSSEDTISKIVDNLAVQIQNQSYSKIQSKYDSIKKGGHNDVYDFIKKDISNV